MHEEEKDVGKTSYFLIVNEIINKKNYKPFLLSHNSTCLDMISKYHCLALPRDTTVPFSNFSLERKLTKILV